MKCIFLFIILFQLFSCQKENKKTSIFYNQDFKKEEEILKKQILNGYLIKENGMDGINNYKYSKEDFEINQNLSGQILKNNGYNFPSENEFNKKTQEIFRFKSSKNVINFLIEYPCPKERETYKADGNYTISSNNPLFIDKNYKILTEALFVPELIDYKTKYPNIAKEEDNLPSEKIDYNGTKLKIIKWKDFSELNDVRNISNQLLVHRNKFLFNNNKGSLAWLQFHDKIFLEALIKTFGYVTNKDLLEWYIKRNGIEKYNENVEEFIKIFYVKTCDQKFIIHNETLSYMDSNPEKYSREILSVLEEIRTDRIKLENLNFPEKTKLIAYLLYFGEKHKEETGLTFAFMGTFYEHSSEDLQKKYDDEFRKNNFYGLPNFDKFWNDAKADGDGIGLDM